MDTVQNPPDSVLPWFMVALVVWFVALRNRIAAHALFPGHSPMEASPLPANFPWINSPLRKNLRFASPFSHNPHTYGIVLAYHHTRYSSHVWMVTCGKYRSAFGGFGWLTRLTEHLIVAVFEAPFEICDGPNAAFTLNPDIVLEGLQRSARAAAAYILVATCENHCVVDRTGWITQVAIETVRLTNASNWVPGRIVAERYMQQCLRCSVPVPLPIQFCALHAR
ncbi:hypothetical protein C8R47DRAFT_1224624 [Mycena vitilis]|nr:hypothetical protein C8R47DRAFT_1224624 [Mycena vitilis]